MESKFIKASELNNRLSEFKDSKFIIEGIIWEMHEKRNDGFILICNDPNVLTKKYLNVFKKYLNNFVKYNPGEGCQHLIYNSKEFTKSDYITHFYFTFYYDDVILEIYNNNYHISKKEVELNFLKHLNFKIIN